MAGLCTKTEQWGQTSMEPKPVAHWSGYRLLIGTETGYSLEPKPVTHWNRYRLLIEADTGYSLEPEPVAH
ncbi:MAG: hypothetical protein LBQ77_01905 [Treponema sp.]|nr:hypothetical protein [Treponema sp.]